MPSETPRLFTKWRKLNEPKLKQPLVYLAQRNTVTSALIIKAATLRNKKIAVKDCDVIFLTSDKIFDKCKVPIYGDTYVKARFASKGEIISEIRKLDTKIKVNGQERVVKSSMCLIPMTANPGEELGLEKSMLQRARYNGYIIDTYDAVNRASTEKRHVLIQFLINKVEALHFDILSESVATPRMAQ